MPNDIFSNVDALPDDNIKMLADRLDARSEMAGFAELRDEYFDRMALADDAHILELGGGTGVIGRAYARRNGFRGTYVVTDLSQSLVDIARTNANSDGVGNRMTFKVADALTGIGLDGENYDAVIMHTLLSHVPDPVAVLRTAADATRPGGTLAIFDADYAGLTITTGKDALDDEVIRTLRQNAVAQPDIMRKVPRIASNLKLERYDLIPTLLAEAGDSEFFVSMSKALAGVISAQGGLDPETARRWIAAIDQAISEGAFFAMCPYFAYLYRKPS